MTVATQKPKKRRDYLFSSKVTRSSALLPETKVLLRYWNTENSIKENLERFQLENILGKSSRQRVAHVLMHFKQRYAKNQAQINTLAFLSQQSSFSEDALNAILLYYYLESDLLVRQLVVETLPQLRDAQKTELNAEDIEPYIQEWVDQGRTLAEWSASTIHTIAVNALTALRDFGLLQGSAVKTFADIPIPIKSMESLCTIKTGRISDSSSLNPARSSFFPLATSLRTLATRHFFIFM
jgi:hypothetical protein